MTTLVWVDGVITEVARATVSALDHGLTVGDGVFETLEVVDGTAFAMRRHLVRLRRSAAVLGLEIGLGDDDLRGAASDLLAAVSATGAEPGRLRITVTGGTGPLGSARNEGPATVLLAAGPASPWPSTADVVTVAWRRNEHSAVAGAKTTSYAENVVALAEAHRRGAGEAIFANTAGALCEGTGTNVFVAFASAGLRTPSLPTGCLAGITRELVLGLVDAEETDALTLDDLRSADEAFLTSSTRGVQPIAMVDGLPLAAAAPGPLTMEAARAFGRLRASDPDP